MGSEVAASLEDFSTAIWAVNMTQVGKVNRNINENEPKKKKSK